MENRRRGQNGRFSVVHHEDNFREAAESWGDMEHFVELCLKYNLEMDFESVPELRARFGLTFAEL